MRDDKRFAKGMLSDLQLWGVDRVDGATVTLAGQIVCTDGARWDVQREFNRRVKMAFQDEGIRMMPTVTSMTGFPHPLDVRLERPCVTRHVVHETVSAPSRSLADDAKAARPQVRS
jgi:hypothetical protein